MLLQPEKVLNRLSASMKAVAGSLAIILPLLASFIFLDFFKGAQIRLSLLETDKETRALHPKVQLDALPREHAVTEFPWDLAQLQKALDNVDEVLSERDNEKVVGDSSRSPPAPEPSLWQEQLPLGLQTAPPPSIASQVRVHARAGSSDAKAAQRQPSSSAGVPIANNLPSTPVRASGILLRGTSHAKPAAPPAVSTSAALAAPRRPEKPLSQEARVRNAPSAAAAMSAALSPGLQPEKRPLPAQPRAARPLHAPAAAKPAGASERPSKPPLSGVGSSRIDDGGSPPAEARRCGEHGASRGGRCLCSRLWEGPRCETPKVLSRFPALQKLQKDFHGSITMSKAGLAGKRTLRVFLPGKESDPDHGNRVLGHVTKGLLDAVPARDIFGGKVFESCAVVGSSGILHHFEFGKEIDDHEMVLRFNSAPTKGFERIVGSKTTHRITNTQNWVFREKDTENILVHMRSTSSLTAVIRTHIGDPDVRLAPFDTDFVHYMANSLPFMATSGLYGIIIALHQCASVDLYGFQVSAKHGAKYHYYNVCDQPANAERDGAEWHVVKAIVEAGLARFREPCVAECHEGQASCERCKRASGFRPVGSYGKAERARCPRCSTQYGGCRPHQHWAFRRHWHPPRGRG
uniref:beta-galactoside alpha-(2,6)-sialyltransferase n=2 Tax=Tetraselmis sp. GSL018 TaxID=582737 RepID=A0A061R1C7_9CHLO|mmetsp:Transcript_17373/g.41511  ORF Transcript_17373/g.41511 Transcript_17373/m.41511 type:complete len:633 (+) Transcript_17373:251-2149(+)